MSVNEDELILLFNVQLCYVSIHISNVSINLLVTSPLSALSV